MTRTYCSLFMTREMVNEKYTVHDLEQEHIVKDL